MDETLVRTTLKAEQSAVRCWLPRPVAERIAAIEALRQHYIAQHFGAEPRLQRVCRVARLERS